MPHDDQQMLPLWRDPEATEHGSSPRMPGEYILAELKKRNWGQADLATIIGRQASAVNDLIQGKRPVSPELAVLLGKAFSTSADLWIHREAAYRLSLVQEACTETEKRAALYGCAPVKEMQRRGWIDRNATTADELEAQLLKFMGTSSIEETPRISAAARKAFPTVDFSSAQSAWLLHAQRMASALSVRPYSEAALEKAFAKLRQLVTKPEDAIHIAPILADAGVRFVVVEQLNHTKVDGAAFFLNDDPARPAVVASLRIDRMESFWHTLIHELEHIKNRDPISIDIDGAEENGGVLPAELKANEGAAEWAIPRVSMNSFILRAKPNFPLERITQFAKRMNAHPCIVIGQLQYLDHIGYDRFADFRPKIREHVIAGTMTDGYGKSFNF